MKPLAWRQTAVQAYAGDRKGHGGGEKKMSRRNGTNGQRPISTPRRFSKSKPAISLSSYSKIDAQIDVWSDDFKPESPPPIPISNFDDPFGGASITPEEFKNGQLGRSLSSKALSSYSKRTQRNTISIPENKPHSLEFLKSTNNSTSTIFRDPQHPITIVLTTPEDELPPPVFPESPTKTGPRIRSFSVTSLPIMPSQTQQGNTSLLMPPTDRQIDTRKLRQRQEFHDIRKWLISFMNAKGDQFPSKLRGRMMKIYFIKDSDLDPEIVARFNAEDEGVSIDQTESGEVNHKESLRILGQAMRSRIEEATPMRRIPAPPPPVNPRKNSLPIAKGSPPRKPLVTIPDDEELPPTWLGPLISTSSSSRDSLLSDEQYLKKSYSTPELHDRPRLMFSSGQDVATVRSRGASLNSEEMRNREKLAQQQSRSKRGSMLSGAFGLMREAFGGRPAKVR